ncbi:magnesium and cobalt transport protein CorA [Patulibacter sp. SYSU D01012]|uniref:magnesium and cobalt transport protein CorA n=1 Tax=Patulibacter sp. SYSU D01012 TaxID=2817381 RepID=UPI001B308373|nr:magnesium and cobalt transport protein CorA [Patulibacter sp. SYSU D01012]
MSLSPRPRRPDPRPSGTADPDAAPEAPGDRPIERAVTDCAVYEHGRREGGVVPLGEVAERLEGVGEDGFLWIGLHDPSPEAVQGLGRRFDLHALVVEDAMSAHQRPKLERHGDLLFLVLKTAEYDDDHEHVAIGELTLILGPRLVVSIRHGAPVPLRDVRAELERDPERLAKGPGVVFHAIVDRVVDVYADVLDGLVTDVDQVEATVFSDVRSNPTERIYRLKREVIAFKRAVTPLVTPLTRLVEDRALPVADAARPYLRDVLDHLVRDAEGVASIDDLLNGVLDANLAQIGVRQADDARKISAWAAIAVVPTAIFGLYGMNFEHMPELRWELGYPAVLVVTLLVCVGLYWRLRRVGWL